MAATFTVGGGNTTVTFDWTKPTAIAQATIEGAAHYLTPDDAIFAGLTNQQKLNKVYTESRRHILNMAQTYHAAVQVAATKVTAAEEALTNLDL